MTVAELEARMSVSEFHEWAAYLAIKAERQETSDDDIGE